MKTIVLLGELGKRFGRRHQLDVASPAEAIRALCANFRDFQKFILDSGERNVAYRVVNVRDDIGQDELHQPAGRIITIVPVIGGAKSGWVKIVVAAALIAASFLIPGLPVVAANILFNVGVSLAISGVVQLLAPPPKPTGGQDQKPSYVFDGAINTTTQGYPVPVGYGRMIVGSAVVSAGISTGNYYGT